MAKPIANVSIERDILSLVAKVRSDLDAIENAMKEELRVPASMDGSTFFEENARRLARLVEKRQLRYDFESEIKTCQCGEWEISEYGDICPSCKVTEVAKPDLDDYAGYVR